MGWAEAGGRQRLAGQGSRLEATAASDTSGDRPHVNAMDGRTLSEWQRGSWQGRLARGWAETRNEMGGRNRLAFQHGAGGLEMRAGPAPATGINMVTGLM